MPTLKTTFVPNRSSSLPPSEVPSTLPLCLSIYYQNVRGLRTKTSTVYLNSQILPYEIFALNETNLTSDFNNSELFTSDFNVFRDDGLEKEDDSSGRGVLLAIHNRLDSTLIKTSHTSNFEFICVKITISKRNIYVLCCYIRPSQPIQGYQLAIDAIDSLLIDVDPCDIVIVLGDFNLPDLQWALSDDETHYVAINPSSDKEFLFIDCLSDSGLHQLSGVTNNLKRQLDLIFSTDADNCIVSESKHLLSKLDQYHPPLSLTFSYNSVNKTLYCERPYSFNFRKADFVKLNALLSNVNFNLNSNLNIENALTKFYTEIFNCFTQSVPFVPQKTPSSSPPWFTKELRSLRNRRYKLCHAYLTSH